MVCGCHVGSKHDGLNYPAHDDAETVQMPVGVTGKETYHRETLSVGDVSTVVYIHDSLSPREVLNLLVEHYKAWAINRPSGRR